MGGGLMQLVAYGAQDIYLTGNPQITFFKVVYRRHTNFAMESVVQAYDGQADYGKSFSCGISRNGDLIHRVYLEVNFESLFDYGDLPVDCNETIAKSNAFSLIDLVEVEIGGQLVDRHYGDWMNIWSELTSHISKANQLRRLVDISSGNTENRVYIPLQFSFCRNPGLAIPLIALQYHEVKLNVKMSRFEDVWGSADPLIGGKITDVCFWIDYIYLDTGERRRFAQTSHEYLIEQLQANRGNCTVENMKVKLNFNHPVKELIWVHDGDCAGFDYKESTDEAFLELNGHERFDKRVGDYFRKVQRYQHHTGSKKISSRVLTNPESSSIQCYSFSLNPEEHQPSGTCNFSRIDKSVLHMNCTVTGPTETNIYGVNYNILRIMSGMGGLAYSN